jgi:cytoskeletal protein CcmA (bactofilin family)
MFDRNGLFSKKEDTSRKDPRAPAQGTAPAGQRTQPEPTRTETAPAPAPLSRNADGKGSKLIVGPDIKLKGVEITDCDTLVVEGRVEASMDSRVIQIAEEGVFQGTAGIDVAEINGRFEGELTARKQLVIRSTGKVTGKIRYGKLSIEEGGELSGDVGTLTAGDSIRKDQPQYRQPAKSLAGMV